MLQGMHCTDHPCMHCLQSCMYREMDAAKRAQDLAALAFQLDVLNNLIKGGPYVNGAASCGFLPVLPATSRCREPFLLRRSMLQTCAGAKVGLADAALFPTLTFCRFMLEPIFGWKPIFDSRPALGRYWAAMEADADAARVRVWASFCMQGCELHINHLHRS